MPKYLCIGLVVLVMGMMTGCSDDDDGPGVPTATPTASPVPATPTSTVTPIPATSTPTLTPVPGTPTIMFPAPAALECLPDTNNCGHTNTELFAIAHAFTDPDKTVYYRVTVPARSTGNDWGDGTNGFFYRATANDGDPDVYVPFNGMSVGADGRPMLPQFTFIVAVDVSAGEDLTIEACASNYDTGTCVAGQPGGTCTSDAVCDAAPGRGDGVCAPPCTEMLWADVYSALPVPAMGLGPAAEPFNVLEPLTVLFDAETGSSASLPNNGVYGEFLVVCPSLDGCELCRGSRAGQGSGHPADEDHRGAARVVLQSPGVLRHGGQSVHQRYIRRPRPASEHRRADHRRGDRDRLVLEPF